MAGSPETEEKEKHRPFFTNVWWFQPLVFRGCVLLEDEFPSLQGPMALSRFLGRKPCEEWRRSGDVLVFFPQGFKIWGN